MTKEKKLAAKPDKKPAPQFKSIGAAKHVSVIGSVIDLECQHGKLRVEVLTPTMIRVRSTRDEEFGPNKSWAVVRWDWPTPELVVNDSGNAIEIDTGALLLQIQKDPARVRVLDKDGNIIAADDEALGTGWCGKGPDCWFAMQSGEKILGLGEKIAPIEKRGRKFVNWNSDNPNHVPSADPLYKTFPVVFSFVNGKGFVRFIDSTWRAHFDMGYTRPELFHYSADGGDLDYYFIYGPDPRQILKQYTDLTGRMPMPPRWSLGHQQCRWGYFPESRVYEIADGLRSRNIPSDVIYLDIDYMDSYKLFTWHPDRFPDPARMTKKLHEQGFKLVTIIDCGIKKEKGYGVYEDGMKKEFYCRKPNGRPFVGSVWPGPSVFPDVTRSEVRDWWGSLHKGLIDLGVDGIWDDMNEPSVFGGVGGTMSENIIQGDKKNRHRHAASHNAYGTLIARATREGLQKLEPGKRGFVLTRSAYAGVQRDAAVWLGDNQSWWEHLAVAMPMCQSVGLTGVPFVGVDIGGFLGDSNPELYARWVEMGAFTPLCRTHSVTGSRDQEPWSFGPETEAIARKYLSLRYALMPYTYTLFWQASQTGDPVMRPLMYEFPDDRVTYSLSYQYLWGSSLLVAPVYMEKARNREVYLPSGRWYDYWTEQSYEGPCWIVANSPLDHLPLYVKAGSIIPSGPVVQYEGEKPIDPLSLNIYCGASGEFTLYEDDGVTLAYQAGVFSTTTINYEETEQGSVLTVGELHGEFVPDRRTVQAVFHCVPDGNVSVRLDGRWAKTQRAGSTLTVAWAEDGQKHTIDFKKGRTSIR